MGTWTKVLPTLFEQLRHIGLKRMQEEVFDKQTDD